MNYPVQIYIEPKITSFSENELKKAPPASFFQLIQQSWAIKIYLKKDSVYHLYKEQIYTPFAPLFERIKNEIDFSSDLSNSFNLNDFCEEKKVIKFENFILEVSWDGNIKISNNIMHNNKLSIYSTNQVYLGDLNVSMLIVTSPFVSLRGDCFIKHFKYCHKKSENEENENKISFEIIQTSKLNTSHLNVDGLLLNKGIIIFKSSCTLKTVSLFNIGSLISKEKVNIKISSFFKNAGRISINDLKIDANTVIQKFENKFTPSIEGQNLLIQNSKNLIFKNGKIKVDNFTIDSQGPVINECTINVLNKLVLSVQTKQFFMQKGYLETNCLYFSGDDSLFTNNGELYVRKFTFNDGTTFENISVYKASINELNFANKKSKLVNTGDLSVLKGSLNKFINAGIFNSHELTVNDLIVENQENKKGKMNVRKLEISCSFTNNGFVTISFLKIKGKLNNNNEIILTNNSIFSLKEVNQNGLFSAYSISGEVKKWNENYKSFIKTNSESSLKFSSVTVYPHSEFQLLGELEVSKFINNGKFVLNGSYLKVCDEFIAGNESLTILQDGNFSKKKDQMTISTISKNTGISTNSFSCQNLIVSKNGLLIDSIIDVQLNKISVEGDVKFIGNQAFQNFQKIDTKNSFVSGELFLSISECSIEINKPIDLNFSFYLCASKVLQKAPIKAKSIKINAKEVVIQENLVAYNNIKIKSDRLESNNLVASIKGSIDITFLFNNTSSFFLNNGTVTTYENSIHIVMNKLQNNGYIISKFLIDKNETKCLSCVSINNFNIIENTGQIVSNQLELTTYRLYNEGIILGNENSLFIVFSILSLKQQSYINLMHTKISIPSYYLEINGIFELDSPEYCLIDKNDYAFNSLIITKESKLIIKNFDFKFYKIINKGEFELYNSKITGTFYTSDLESITSLYGDFYVEAKVFNEKGTTKYNENLHIICGDSYSSFGINDVKGSVKIDIKGKTPNRCISLILYQMLCGKDTTNYKFMNISNSINNYIKQPLKDELNMYTEPTIIVNAKQSEIILEKSYNINCDKALILNVKSFINHSKLLVKILELNLSDDFYSNGSIVSQTDIKINTSIFDTQNGHITANNDIEIKAFKMKNSNSCITANNNINIVLSDDLKNENGVIINSKKGDLIISTSGHIENNKSIMIASIFNFHCQKYFVNKSGLLLALDHKRTSSLCARTMFNSCDYHTEEYKKNILSPNIFFRYPITISKTIIDGNPGEIFVSGDFELDGNVISEGGRIYVKGRILNDKNKYPFFSCRNISYYKSIISAYGGDLTMRELYSIEGKLIFGPGGLQIKSKNELCCQSDSLKKIIFSSIYKTELNTINPLAYAQKYPSLFNILDDGFVKLRFNEDETEWNLSSLVTTKAITTDLDKLKCMITPSAFKLVLSLIPPHLFGGWNFQSDDILPILNEVAYQSSSNQILSLKDAYKLQNPSLIWEINNNKFYPLIVIPKSYSNSFSPDIYSDGNVLLYSNKLMKLENINIDVKGTVEMISNKKFKQIGGSLECNKIGIKAPNIYHVPNGNCSPKIDANELIHVGKTHIISPEMKIGIYHQFGGLNVESKVLTDTFFKYKEEGKVTTHVMTTKQSIIPSKIMINQAYFHSDTKLKGVFLHINETYKFSELKLEAQVLTDEYSVYSKKSGFFSSSEMRANGVHQHLQPSILKGNLIKDMKPNCGSLKMKSSCIDVAQIDIQSDIKQQMLELQNYDFIETKTSGISLPWFSDPMPALVKSANELMNSTNKADLVISGMKTLNGSFSTINDVSKLMITKGAHMQNIIKGFASKIASFSIGTTREKQEHCQKTTVPNMIKGNDLKIKNNKTDIKGSVKFNKIEIETNKLLGEAPINKSNSKKEFESTSFTFSPVDILPSISHSHLTDEKTMKTVGKAQITANKMKIKVKNDMHIKGTQLVANKLDLDVKNDLIVESIQDEVDRKGSEVGFNISLGATKHFIGTNQNPLSVVPTIFSSDYHAGGKSVNNKAMIAANQMNVKVGGELVKVSADVGTIKNGKINTDKGVKASRITDKKLKEIKYNEKNTFVAPIAEAAEMISNIKETVSFSQIKSSNSQYKINQQQSSDSLTTILNCQTSTKESKEKGNNQKNNNGKSTENNFKKCSPKKIDQQTSQINDITNTSSSKNKGFYCGQNTSQNQKTTNQQTNSINEISNTSSSKNNGFHCGQSDLNIQKTISKQTNSINDISNTSSSKNKGFYCGQNTSQNQKTTNQLTNSINDILNIPPSKNKGFYCGQDFTQNQKTNPVTDVLIIPPRSEGETETTNDFHELVIKLQNSDEIKMKLTPFEAQVLKYAEVPPLSFLIKTEIKPYPSSYKPTDKYQLGSIGGAIGYLIDQNAYNTEQLKRENWSKMADGEIVFHLPLISDRPKAYFTQLWRNLKKHCCKTQPISEEEVKNIEKLHHDEINQVFDDILERNSQQLEIIKKIDLLQKIEEMNKNE